MAKAKVSYCGKEGCPGRSGCLECRRIYRAKKMEVDPTLPVVEVEEPLRTEGAYPREEEQARVDRILAYLDGWPGERTYAGELVEEVVARERSRRLGG